MLDLNRQNVAKLRKLAGNGKSAVYAGCGVYSLYAYMYVYIYMNITFVNTLGMVVHYTRYLDIGD